MASRLNWARVSMREGRIRRDGAQREELNRERDNISRVAGDKEDE